MSDNSLPTVEMAVLNAETVAVLKQALYGIRRDALSVVKVCEDLLDLPCEKRAIKTQAEIIAERNLAYRERMKTEKTAVCRVGHEPASPEAKSVSSVDSLEVSC